MADSWRLLGLPWLHPNNDLTHDFHRWYPGFTHTTTDRHDLAA
ncbi:MAG: hypothetical protein ACRDRQ_13835 [Pseudonocardiaceae bacterium]